LRLVAQESFSVAVVDLFMPRMGGLELADRLRLQSPDTQVVILTGQPDFDSAVEGIRQGVFDYLEKAQLQMGRLLRSVEAANDRSSLVRHNRELVAALSESNALLKGLHASSEAISTSTSEKRSLTATSLCSASFTRPVRDLTSSDMFSIIWLSVLISAACRRCSVSIAALRVKPMAPTISWNTLGPTTPSEALPTIASAMNMPPSRASATLSRFVWTAAVSPVAVMILTPNRFTKH